MRTLRAAMCAATGLLLQFGTAKAADISGVWQISQNIRELKMENGKTPPLRPAAARIYARHKAQLRVGQIDWDPTSRCVSPSLPRILTLPYPFQIIQRPDRILYLFQWNYWNRDVYVDESPEQNYPLSLGYGRAHLNDRDVTIETTGLNPDNTWLDSAGMPKSNALKITEKLSLADGGQTLVDRITVDDKGVFSRPWTTVLRFKRLPDDTVIKEDVCLDRIEAGLPAVAWP